MRAFLAYVLMMVAGAAHAGAWEEFERRCLVPMENVQEPVTEGLVIEHKNGAYEVFSSVSPNFVFFNIRLPMDRPQCGVEV